MLISLTGKYARPKSFKTLKKNFLSLCNLSQNILIFTRFVFATSCVFRYRYILIVDTLQKIKPGPTMYQNIETFRIADFILISQLVIMLSGINGKPVN